MKKRIFIAMHYMEIGGAETALIGMLQTMNFNRYDVDLFLHSHQGEMMRFIPKEVNLLPEIVEYSMIERPILHVLRAGCFSVAYARLKAKLQFKRYKIIKGIDKSAAIFQYVSDAVTPILPSLDHFGVYDLAISYLNPHNIVRDKVLAKKKICWIHTDYTRVDINVEQELPVWSSYDYVMSISPDVTKTFLSVFPSLKNHIIEMENILSPTFVRQRAEEFNVTDELSRLGGADSVKILSIGRFSHQKNFDNVPDICCRMNSLLNENEKRTVKWYIIGYGGDEALIRQKIIEAGMQDNVIILGKRTNPYPYIKACDIYVQPSRYEGKSVTVREAQMLCKPVVVTDYPTASSQIRNGVDGVIVPMDNEGCANGIMEFLYDVPLREHIKDYLSKHDYGNTSEVRKLDYFIQ